MPSVPRIVVVDATGEVARIVRGALALLNRQSILVEVPTSDDALAEVTNSTIDLVVTAYQIPGEMHGIDLANHVSHESLGSPVIILAEEGDPQLDDETIEQSPFQYFVRPVAEPFLRGLRIALDGEAAVAAENSVAGPEVNYGPLPPLDINSIRGVISGLVRDVGAMAVVLADRSGRVLIEQGATGYIDRESMAAILGPMIARVAEISPLVGGNAWAMHYYNGERLDVYGLGLGIHYLMFLVFEANHRAMAAVMLYGRQAAHQLIDVIGEAAYLTRQTEPLPPPKEKEPEIAPTPKRRAKSMPAPAARAEPAPLPEVEETPVDPILEPVGDMDLDALFGQAVDETTADSLFDPDELSDMAAEIDADDADRVGYDEALDMGILDE
jgi:FixJ family two-component response regulator